MKKITLLLIAFIAFAFSFTAKAQCNYTLEMNDSWGDGWNGNTIDVIVNGSPVLNDVTIANGYQGTLTFSVNDGDAITTLWNGGGLFGVETSYRILNTNNAQVGSGAQTSITTAITASCPSCDIPSVTYSVVTNCPVDNGFSISVDVTDIGAASSVTISDNQGTTPLVVAVTGTYSYGAYANATNVVITVVNDDDGDCSTSSGTLTFAAVCPPANDDFANAAPIACDDNVTGNTSTATLDENDAPDGFGADMDAPNLWYVFDSSVSGAADVTINMCPSSYDTSFLVYTGTSGNLTLVGGNDDGGTTNCPGSGTRSFGSFVADGVQSYYIAVEGYNVGSVGAFDLTLTCVAAEPAPPNDECVNAEALTFTVTTSGTTVGATQNGTEEQPSCDLFGSIADVWYSVVLASPGDLSVSTIITGTSTQANVAIYSACGGLQADQVGCADGNAGEDLTVTGLAAGTYYIRVWSDGVAARIEGTFNIVADFTLSNPDINNQDAFTYYPNPVKNTLQLNAQTNIQNVSIYNMLGQEVLRTAPNNVNSTVDMSAFQTGAYFVKVTINDRTETIRVIKQ